jgi:ElaA protein
MIWKVKPFSELSLNEFHDILELRINVFVVEQNCPYPELDGKDRSAEHLLAMDESSNRIIAYSRLFKPGVYYKQAAFGRVVVHPDYRRQNIGHELVDRSIKFIKTHYGTSDIRIGAQTYLTDFYKQHGFKTTGKPYLEDGIPHVYMVL